MGAKKTRPRSVTLRTYQVGFGDCFLLSFAYPRGERHVLIDFGSTRRPTGYKADHMLRVAADIKERTSGKLHGVVATHRHKDHISGFATGRGGGGPGDIIRSCSPSVVLMPWTEQPDLDQDAIAPGEVGDGSRAFARSLLSMSQAADGVQRAVSKHKERIAKSYLKEIEFIADDNLSNRSALENLATMAKKTLYLYYGRRPTALERLLPGVAISVLGPPTLEQTQGVRRQRARDKDEFWHLQGLADTFWRVQALANQYAAADGKQLFSGAETFASAPPDMRWFSGRLQQLWSQQLLSLVRSLDHAMNNTSLILLFKVGRRRLLFPGDAQIENWEYALRDAPERKKVLADLAAVHLYKVGHHGSLNATPRTLWDNFDKRSAERNDSNRLRAVLSTMPHVHGSSRRKTEVPRRTLVDELEKMTDLLRTDEDIKSRRLYEDIELTV